MEHPGLSHAGDYAPRIDDLLRRGLAAAQHAYDTGQFGMSHGQALEDRVIVGTPLVLAHALLRAGDAEAVATASGIIDEVLALQERHPRHPHRGNWPRFVGDDFVGDLNSAPFILRWLVPLLARHGPQLPADLLARCHDSLRLALAEIERLDVAPSYTNIHLQCLFALLAGGQVLADDHIRQVGRDCWARWVGLAVQTGSPREYNSTTYLGMDLTVLAKLADLVDEPATRLQARLLYERYWLDVAVRLHRPTGRLAGPHARCYWAPMVTGQDLLGEILWRETGWTWPLEPGPYGGHPVSALPVALELALTDHWLPPFVVPWLEQQAAALPYEVRETASLDEGYDLATYLTPAYALGTASRTYTTGTNILAIELMANHCILHYRRPAAAGGWGLAYARYVVNDQHWGTLRSFPHRPKTNFYDQGHFAGTQARNKAIALYALMPLHNDAVFSLKTVVAFQSGPALERLWVDDMPVAHDSLPRTLAPGQWLIVEDGDVYIAVWPLEPSCLGHATPIMLERGPLDEVWLTIYNYRGPAKQFWEYGSLGGAYWRGNLRAGFIVEVAERAAYATVADFLAALRQAVIEDRTDERFIRTVTYRRGGDELSLDYDLWRTEPRERRINGQVYTPPALASPLGVQGDSGVLAAGSARLVTDPGPAWLIAQEVDPARRTWIAVNPLDRPTPVRLETPCGVVGADRWGLGRLEWRAPAGGRQELIVETLAEPVGLRVPAGVTMRRQAPGGD